MSAMKVILDCDPGLDDTFAILLALAAPEAIDLLGITVVAGNTGLEFTARNARLVCELAGRRDVKIYAGCTRAIMSSGSRAPEIHGEDGLGGVELPEPGVDLQPEHAVDFIIESCLAAKDGEMILCPIGPMTNIALAIVKEPAIIAKIKQIVFMGGAAFRAGNITSHAEFNIHVDPHAAEIVLQSGIPCVMLGLDVTHQAVITDDRLHAIGHLEGLGPILAQMLAYYARSTRKAGGESENGVLHDPCAIAYLIAPEIFSGRPCFVHVETTRGHGAIGKTVVNDSGETNCLVITKMDDAAFYDLMIGRIQAMISAPLSLSG